MWGVSDLTVQAQGGTAAGRPEAIVLGLEHPRALAAVGSLGQAGIPVIGVDHRASAKGFSSRFLREKFRISADPDQALAFLEQLGERRGGVLIPTNDDYLILVAKHFDQLSRYFVLTMPPWEILGELMDQARCYALAAKAGVKTPRFFKPRDEEQLNDIISELDLEHHAYLLKTMPGTIPADPRTGRFTKVAGTDTRTIQDNCLEIFSRLGEFPMIVQVVPGEADRCIGVSMVVNREHEAVVSYCVRRLKLYTYSRSGGFVHPYELGANVYCESIHDDEATEAAIRFVRLAAYYGVITVEFRRDPSDDALTLIKADPRFVRATSLSTALGLDVPTALYHVFTDGQVETSRRYPEGVAWVWLIPYMETLWANRSNRPVRQELFALLRKAHRIKAWAYLNAHDPMPFLQDLAPWARQKLNRAARRLGRSVMDRIDWRGTITPANRRD